MVQLLLRKCLLPSAGISVKFPNTLWHLSNSKPFMSSVTHVLKTRANLTGTAYSAHSVRSFSFRKLWLLWTKGKPSVAQLGTVRAGFALSVTGAVFLRTWYSHSLMRVKCEAGHSTRIQDISNNSSESPLFPWLEFVKLLLPDILYLIAAVASAFAVAIVNIKIPHFLGDVVNVLSKFTGDATKEYLAEIRRPAIRLVAVYGLQSLLTFVYISLLTFVGERLVERLKKKLFASLIQQDIAFFDVHKTGEILSRLTADTQDLKSSFKLCISQGLRSLTQTVGCVVSSYFISPKMTLMMVIVIPSIIITGWLLGSILRRLSKDAQAQVAMSAAVADEALGNMRTVRAFAMEDSEMHLFNIELKKACSMNERLGVGIALFQGLSNLALNGIVLGTLFVGGHLVSAKELSPGDLMAFLVTSQTIQRSLGQMSLLFGQAIKAVAAGARIFEYIKSTPLIPLKGGRKIPFHSLLGAVEYENVTFAYPSRSQHVVLDNFSLKLAPGTVVAVCGLSGSGKSTMAALLERFYDVQQGSIKLDGVDIRNLDPTWLRGHVIGFISQEPVLFATSVRENIRYSRPDASDAEVYEAATLANADQFILNFPEGYDTVLGERGATVSGGQKQRIAIARALLKNPSIIILDEATSALDAESEHLVKEALDRVIRGRTVLVIAHRLSTIQNADTIAVLNDGVIAEKGTHAELKRRRGLYWHLIKHQQEERELEMEGHTKYRPNGRA